MLPPLVEPAASLLDLLCVEEARAYRLRRWLLRLHRSAKEFVLARSFASPLHLRYAKLATLLQMALLR